MKIIAEMAWGHDGSVTQAIELLCAAKKAGADLFSIHITDLPSYMVNYYGSGEGKVSAGREELDVYKYLTQINLTEDEWEIFAKEAKNCSMPLCVMPNDSKSLRFSEEKINPDAYVISAACFVEVDFLEEVAKLGKLTFFRIGGAYLGEIEKAIEVFKKNGNQNVVLLYGFQNYPTKLEETNLAFLRTLNKMFNLEVGLADHIDGADELAIIVPSLATAYGATYIEKHITLDRKAKSEDFESALDPVQFEKMGNLIKASEIAIGKSYITELSAATLRYRQVSRKRIVANSDLNQGHVLGFNDLIFKRCDIGLTPDQVDTIIGRSLKQNVKKDDAITLNLI
ncbi:MAG: hypothetical protein GW809_01280 [Bacteroidetes bacterium]|nr:hypothetical protein [Bacteroidota bacterium]